MVTSPVLQGMVLFFRLTAVAEVVSNNFDNRYGCGVLAVGWRVSNKRKSNTLNFRVCFEFNKNSPAKSLTHC